MSDIEASLPKRPASVIAVAVLIFVAAILQLFATAASIFLALRPGEAQHLFSQPTSDLYWWMTAVLSFLLAIIYVWIGRGLLRGDPQSWLLVNVLTLINMVFALFQIAFGTGWITLAVGLLILIMNNTMSARAWFKLERTT